MEIETVKDYSRSSKDHFEDLVRIDFSLARSSLQSWPEEVAYVVAAGVVEGVAAAEIAEGLIGRSIN